MRIASRRPLLLPIACCFVVTWLVGAGSAQGLAYYSITGDFIDATGTPPLSVDFRLDDSVGALEPFQMRTWSYEGGVNREGRSIPGGSFDPVLRLFGPGFSGIDDDISVTNLDAAIDHETPGIPSTVPAGEYELEVDAAGPVDAFDPIAFDVVGPAGDIVLTDIHFSQVTLDSLALGTQNADEARARASIGPSSGFLGFHELIVGAGGNGTMVADDFRLLQTSGTIVGDSMGSSGELRVINGTHWGGEAEFDHRAADVTVGGSGSGTVQLESGATGELRHVVLGNAATGEGSLTLSGAETQATVIETTSATTGLEVGRNGAGSLRIEQGAQFVAEEHLTTPVPSQIGVMGGSEGEVTVANSDSQWTTEDVTIATSGTGTLTIADGGNAHTRGDAFIARNEDADGTVMLQDFFSEWNVDGSLYVGGSDEAAGGNGVLRLDDPLTRVTVGSEPEDVLRVWPTGTLSTSSVTISGPVVMEGETVIEGSFAALTVDDDYTQTETGLLEMNIGGTEESEYDRMIVSGDAELDGVMDLVFVDEFAPSQGEVFDLLTVVGALDTSDLSIEIENLLPGFEYETSFDGMTFQLTALNDGEFEAMLAGDYNDNGQVEQADLDLVLLNWGEPFDALPSEWVNQQPETGIVDQAELDGVLLNWGNAAGRPAAVPEPATGIMAVVAFMAGIALYCSRRGT